MSFKRPAKDQPQSFEFNSSSLEAANKTISKYPKGKQQSAVMPLLYLVQEQNENWIPLKQKLKYGRNKHLTLEISKDTLANIMDNNL